MLVFRSVSHTKQSTSRERTLDGAVVSQFLKGAVTGCTRLKRRVHNRTPMGTTHDCSPPPTIASLHGLLRRSLGTFFLLMSSMTRSFMDNDLTALVPSVRTHAHLPSPHFLHTVRFSLSNCSFVISLSSPLLQLDSYCILSITPHNSSTHCRTT